MPKKGTIRLSDTRIKAICKAVKNGNTYRAACALTGTPESTFFSWTREAHRIVEADAAKTKGRRRRRTERDRVLVKFLKALQKADAEAETRNILIIQTAAQQHWTAAAWWLERRKPRDYGRKVMYEPTRVAEGEPVKTPAELAAEMDATIGAPSDSGGGKGASC